jgi:hypothetical protein
VGSEAIDVSGFHGDVVAPRTRGRPARISRERIIAAARTIAPEALTMQKVADVLGVDPMETATMSDAVDQLAQAMRDLINERPDTSRRRQRRGDGRGGRWSSQWWGARAQPIRGVCEAWVTSR